MTAVQFKGFRGRVSRLSERLQTANFASEAKGIKITSGRLDPLQGLLPVFNTGRASIGTMWLYRRFVETGETLEQWMVFVEPVDAVLSPLANDEKGRFYWTSDSHEPRYSNYARAVANAPYPSGFYALGVPGSSVPPAVTPPSPSASNVIRSYAYTLVSADGEEGGPSPASDPQNGSIDSAWVLAGMLPAPPSNGNILGAVRISANRVRVSLDTVFGLRVGDVITLVDVVGMTELNGQHRLLSVNTADASVDVETKTSQAYISGGTWIRDAVWNTEGMRKRIYRSEGTDKQFYFVAEIPAEDATYADSIPGNQLGELIETTLTLPPPATLKCLVSLPNGCLAGIAGNEVCFSDPYKPYSWPASNRYAFSGRGVALVPSGTSVIVLTDSYPILLSGTDPESMSSAVMETYAPCIAKRGVVNVGGGALYPAPDGLWLVAPGAVQKRTARLYRQAEWDALNPTSFIAAYREGQYFASHQPVGKTNRQMLIIDVEEMDSDVVLDEPADAIYASEADGRLYVAKGRNVYQWDAAERTPYEGVWRSVEVQLGQPTNFSVAQVHADWSKLVLEDMTLQLANQAVAAQGPYAVSGQLAGFAVGSVAVGGSNLAPIQPWTPRAVRFELYDQDEIKFSRNVTNSRPFRLPAGFKIEVVRVGLAATVPVFGAAIAQSTAELAGAST